MSGSIVFRVAVIMVLSLASGVFHASPALAQAPVHDDFDAAVVVRDIPFTDRQDASEATSASDDPVCNEKFGEGYTVWYQYTPSVNIRLSANTFGSGYDTTLSVYTGERGALKRIACNDDTAGVQSRVIFDAQAGAIYFFMVGSIADVPAGRLVFSIDFPPPPLEVALSVDPSGLFEPVADAAIISGEVECSRQAYVDVYVVVKQGIGRETVRGAALFSQERCVGIVPWTVEVTGDDRPFVEGEVEVTATAYAFTEDEYYGYDEVSSPVRVNSEAGTVQLVGQLGGDSYAVEVVGRYAYLGVGPRLVIVDITNPARPTRVGQTMPLAESLYAITISGSYAYLAGGDDGLHIVNVSDPAAPFEVGAFDTSGFAYDVAFAGDYAYVADGGSGLTIINVSYPAWPYGAGSFNMPSVEVEVAGNYAYVLDTKSDLHIINVSNPSASAEVGYYPGDLFLDLELAGKTIYVADVDIGLRMFDVSNPAAPLEVGFFDTPEPAGSVAVVGKTAYVTAGGLHMIDVTDPAAPFEASFSDTPSSEVAAAGNFAYVIGGDHHLQVIDLSDPASPAVTGFYGTPSRGARSLAVAGKYTYVAGSDGLRIINVSNPAAPTEAGHSDQVPVISSVAVAGRHAYGAYNIYDSKSGLITSGLRILNVSNPAAPLEVGAVDTPGSALDVAVAGKYAYLAYYLYDSRSGQDTSGLRVIDVSNPAAPLEVGAVDTPGIAQSVAVAGKYAYVADSDAGLRIIDVSNPAAPREAGFYDTPEFAVGVAVAGRDAYVADGSSLRIIDVSDPEAPFEAGSAYTPGSASGVAVAGKYAYVAAGNGGLRMLDVTDPTAPYEVDAYDLSPFAADVTAVGDIIYVADSYWGLLIFSANAHLKAGDAGIRPEADPRTR